MDGWNDTELFSMYAIIKCGRNKLNKNRLKFQRKQDSNHHQLWPFRLVNEKVKEAEWNMAEGSGGAEIDVTGERPPPVWVRSLLQRRVAFSVIAAHWLNHTFHRDLQSTPPPPHLNNCQWSSAPAKQGRCTLSLEHFYISFFMVSREIMWNTSSVKQTVWVVADLICVYSAEKQPVYQAGPDTAHGSQLGPSLLFDSPAPGGMSCVSCIAWC